MSLDCLVSYANVARTLECRYYVPSYHAICRAIFLHTHYFLLLERANASRSARKLYNANSGYRLGSDDEVSVCSSNVSQETLHILKSSKWRQSRLVKLHTPESFFVFLSVVSVFLSVVFMFTLCRCSNKKRSLATPTKLRELMSLL